MSTHHAYVFFAQSLEASLVPKQFQTKSLDVHHVIVPRFGIDDARDLTMVTQQRPLAGPTRVFVIVSSDIALEAQNALLKLFEEPPVYAQFYLVVPQTAFLLPTLRSRLMAVEGEHTGTESSAVLSDFLKLSYGQRISLVGEKAKEKDFVWIEALLQESEREYASNTQTYKDLLQAIVLIRTYISTKGASVKMLLEELALALPQR